MRRFLPFFVVLFFSTAAFAALHFPALTGRVVDDAHILSQSTIASLDTTLADYERGTTNQVVVVTLPSLQGDAIEDYGYQLGRYWGIGQKGKDNGVLLIIAPQEHKVRIEVGYGLEGVMTDAASSAIVYNIILPEFKSGHMQEGIVDGTQAIVSVLGGKGVPAAVTTGQQGQQESGWQLALIILVLFLWLAIRHPFITAMFFLNSSSRFGSSDSGGFSGFNGGGGSFGGGGASGSW